MWRRIGLVWLVLVMVLAACAVEDDQPGSGDQVGVQSSTTVATPGSPTSIPDSSEGVVRTTSGDTTGNRFSPGRGNVLGVEPVDVPLSGTPSWVVGVEANDGLVWVVALDDGRTEAWRLENGRPAAVRLNLDRLPAGAPPLVIAASDGPVVVAPPDGSSATTFPVPLPGGGLAFVTDDGALVTAVDGQLQTFDIDALPDTHITISDEGLVAVLAEATTRYPHGVVGDPLEAGRVTIIDPVAGEVAGEAVVADPDVIEGIAAQWADVDGDGDQEILVTVSNGSSGARLVVFDERGQLVAEGPPIGRGNRWRNQLGAAPFGPNGEIEVVDVRVPHIGGVVEFFRLESGQLVRVAEQEGFTSHTIGSRNLDLALAADADGDGRVEVVVPTQSRDALGLLRRSADGVDVAGVLELPGRLTTNLAAGLRSDGTLALAAGTDDEVLRIWPADSSE